ncbi:hypothetical protein, partial [Marichromatium sp. AB31]|uniref:hypothetical protein n=1 Tax=Marichromatium sp. AB31 TaxID=2483362 RepID=UPI001CC2171F
GKPSGCTLELHSSLQRYDVRVIHCGKAQKHRAIQNPISQGTTLERMNRQDAKGAKGSQG